jgi:hypothetical protein
MGLDWYVLIVVAVWVGCDFGCVAGVWTLSEYAPHKCYRHWEIFLNLCIDTGTWQRKKS